MNPMKHPTPPTSFSASDFRVGNLIQLKAEANYLEDKNQYFEISALETGGIDHYNVLLQKDTMEAGLQDILGIPLNAALLNLYGFSESPLDSGIYHREGVLLHFHKQRHSFDLLFYAKNPDAAIIVVNRFQIVP